MLEHTTICFRVASFIYSTANGLHL